MSEYKRAGLVVASLGVLALIGILATMLWSRVYEYTSLDGLTIRTNILTGTQSRRTGLGWQEINEREVSKQESRVFVKSSGGMMGIWGSEQAGQITGTVYNGANSYLTTLTLTVHITNPLGNSRSRIFDLREVVPPHTTKAFSLETGMRLQTEDEWNVTFDKATFVGTAKEVGADRDHYERAERAGRRFADQLMEALQDKEPVPDKDPFADLDEVLEQSKEKPRN